MSQQDLTRAPHTDPLPLYRYRDGLYAVDLLGAALLWLDFFSWLDDHPSDKATICRSLGIAERPADVMLTLFTAMGLVQSRDGVFSLTEQAKEFLVKTSPWFMGPYYAALKDRPVCKDYVEVLRTGKPANWGSLQNEKDWTKAMEDETFAQSFTAAMDCRGIFLGQEMAKHLDLRERSRLLDVAGGSGIYACSVVARHRHLKATVLEKPPVDRVAANVIAKRGYADRVSVKAGDMFAEEFPGGCDVHLISNVLHDWDEPDVKTLLAKSFRALPSGGLLVIHDMHINETKSGPLAVAEYSALLMHSTWGKCYSLAELKSYFGEIGFVEMKFVPTAADRSIVTARKN